MLATPIGHIDDLTIRALEVLKRVDWIACEDTRRTLKLLNHYGVHKPLMTVFGPKEKSQTPRILRLLSESKSVALLSDAGTPGISDPGNLIVREAIAQGCKVLPIPGVSALACALSVSGCAADGFVFLGFLRRKKSKIMKELKEAASLGKAIVFFESPYRIEETLSAASEVLGRDSYCWIGREMTKRFEEYMNGSLGAVLDRIRGRDLPGEFTVILKP